MEIHQSSLNLLPVDLNRKQIGPAKAVEEKEARNFAAPENQQRPQKQSDRPDTEFSLNEIDNRHLKNIPRSARFELSTVVSVNNEQPFHTKTLKALSAYQSELKQIQQIQASTTASGIDIIV